EVTLMNFHPTIRKLRVTMPAIRRVVISLLLMAGLVSANMASAQAEPNAPEPNEQRKPSAAVQLYTAGVQLAPLLPDLLGLTEPQTYLLLLQNNHELRATGGFITAVGRVTLDKGRIAELVI